MSASCCFELELLKRDGISASCVINSLQVLHLGTYYSPRWRRADVKVPDLPVDVSSWGRSTCYP
ncbi:non-specific lipid-transfer protein [Salix suchowensis]|nr:non-specific lipid-transfer protein [Salix suchowensis]